MELLNIMLVDDEEKVKNAIINKLDWEALGYKVAGEASNGEEALEKIETSVPDVILTDIRMPFMDGIELTQKLQKHYPSIKVVIFTGFDEFEYAKQAIRLNVIEYILKPVNLAELSEVLDKIRRNIVSEIAEKRDIAALKEKYHQSLPFIKERFLVDLIHGKYNRNTALAKELIERYDMPIGRARHFMAATIMVHETREGAYEKEAFHDMKELTYISILQLLNERFKDRIETVTFRTTIGIVVILLLSKEQGYRQIVDKLNYFCTESVKLLDIHLTIGLGSICECIPDISNSYEESKDAICYYQIIGKDRAIYISDVEPLKKSHFHIDQSLKDDLVNAIKFGTELAVTDCVIRIMNEINMIPLHMKQKEMYYFALVDQIIQVVQRYELDEKYILGCSKSFTGFLYQLMTEPNAAGLLKGMCKRIHENMNKERADATNKLIQKAINFIQGNYFNIELTGEMVCRHLHISQTYFSTIFKRETGQSYVAYLTELRLNKAIELLKETEDKTYIIAEKVGYAEANYFSYVFKKKFGVAPSKYLDMIKVKTC